MDIYMNEFYKVNHPSISYRTLYRYLISDNLDVKLRDFVVGSVNRKCKIKLPFKQKRERRRRTRELTCTGFFNRSE